jgi:hypothetical protein
MLFPKEVKDIESKNSFIVVEVGLDEIPLTLSVDSKMPCSLIAKVSPFHVNFYLNEVMIATHFDKGSRTIILYPRLKELL